jgi:hypothetical protein
MLGLGVEKGGKWALVDTEEEWFHLERQREREREKLLLEAKGGGGGTQCVEERVANWQRDLPPPGAGPLLPFSSLPVGASSLPQALELARPGTGALQPPEAGLETMGEWEADGLAYTNTSPEPAPEPLSSLSKPASAPTPDPEPNTNTNVKPSPAPALEPESQHAEANSRIATIQRAPVVLLVS